MFPLMDLFMILHILSISLLIIFCTTKKRLAEQIESLFDVRTDNAEINKSKRPDEKKPSTLGSIEKKPESLAAVPVSATKPTICPPEAIQPSPASSNLSQPAREFTPPSPMFKSPPPKPPHNVPKKESTPPKYLATAKAKSAEIPATIKNEPSAAAKPGNINKPSSNSKAAPGDSDAKATGEVKKQAEEKDKNKNNNMKLEDTPFQGKEKRSNVFAAAAKKFTHAIYPMKGIEQNQSIRKGSLRKSSKSKQHKNSTNKIVKETKGKDETKTGTTDEPQFLSEKKQAKEVSFNSSKVNQAEPQFISGRKVDEGHKAKEELFKSCKMGKGAFKTGKTNKEKANPDDDDDYDEGDDTLQGIKSLKQDLDIPSTVD